MAQSTLEVLLPEDDGEEASVDQGTTKPCEAGVTAKEEDELLPYSLRNELHYFFSQGVPLSASALLEAEAPVFRPILFGHMMFLSCRASGMIAKCMRSLAMRITISLSSPETVFGLVVITERYLNVFLWRSSLSLSSLDCFGG